jgi:excisionase family DNA binding protein
MERRWKVSSALLNTPEAARFLSVSKRTLQELASERKVAQIKFGRNVRYSIADLEAFIDANRSKAIGWKGASK